MARLPKDDERKPTTTDAGIPVPSDEFSLTVTDGPILLQDHYLIEQMANFNWSGFRTSAACREAARLGISR
jgi:catalase